MLVLVTKSFGRFQQRERISDDALRDAVRRAEKGIIDANLGVGLIKQRIARPGQGRSGGYRTVIAFRNKHRSVFLYGFAKSERDNIDPDELEEWRVVGSRWLSGDNEAMEQVIEDSGAREVYYESENEEE